MADINELKDEALDEVSGGIKVALDAAIAPIGRPAPINLIGYYWANAAKNSPAYDAARGWANLYIQQYSGCGPANYLITRNGTAIGWTEPGNFNYR